MHHNIYRCVRTFLYLTTRNLWGGGGSGGTLYLRTLSAKFQKCCAMFRVAAWLIIQWSPGCTLAGPGSPCASSDLGAAAGRGAAEGTPAGRGCTPPGCRASGWVGSRDRLQTERRNMLLQEPQLQFPLNKVNSSGLFLNHKIQTPAYFTAAAVVPPTLPTAAILRHHNCLINVFF